MSVTAVSASDTEVRRDPNIFVSIVACAAAAAHLFVIGSLAGALTEQASALLAFVGLTLLLQLLSVEVYGRGATSFSSVGLLAIGFTFGVGAAMATAGLMGVANLVARRGRLNRGIFDAAQFMLSAGAGAAVYAAIEPAPVPAVVGAVAAGAAYMVVNVGLLVVAIGLAERAVPLDVWRERFRWLTPYYLVAGPLAYALTTAYDSMGLAGLAAFALPPAMMMFSMRQYVERTKQGVAEVRRANEELRVANDELATRNGDLQALLQFAGGLASRAHDRAELVTYAHEALARITGARVAVREAGDVDGVELVSGGKLVGKLEVDLGTAVDEARWRRLREAIVPQLATAIESADLVDHVRRTHLATIAALSKSMEAKDFYTGGHTERVASVAVALARRLGFHGAELDAVEVGALLHDIGKIGIPERILQKPGPLDEDEWAIMKEHPVISEYILSEVDLHPMVLQVARSSHERIDGTGYPDGKSGDDIPLPARITLVADAFDALTSDRPYRLGRSIPEAIEELRAHAGTQFCPVVIEAMERLYADEPELLGLARRAGDAVTAA
ncbi:MAG: HD-GYP domain-containing protein [Gaiellaceae bacterium]